MEQFDVLTTLTKELSQWGEAAVQMLPNLAVGLALGLVFWLLGKLVRRGLERGLRRTSLGDAPRAIFVRAAHFAVLAAGLMIILSVLHLDKAVTSVLAGAGVVGLALGFAFQDLASNVISGIGLSLRRPFHTGDVIETNDVLGVAEDIRLRTTTVRAFDGKRVLIPNNKIFQEILVNHTDNELRRVELVCGVSYGDDLEKVREVTLKALEGVESRDTRREPELYFDNFGNSSIDYTAWVWIDFKTQKDLRRARSEMVMAIKKAYDANDITIPFPIRTLDFGIKGGETLAEMLPNGHAEDATGLN